MEHIEAESAAVEKESQYGRNTFDERLEKLKKDAIGRPFDTFEASLSQAGTDVEQLKEWINNPDVLADENVESFMRQLAVLMTDFKIELGEGKSYNPETVKPLQKQVVALLQKYFE